MDQFDTVVEVKVKRHRKIHEVEAETEGMVGGGYEERTLSSYTRPRWRC